MPVSFASGALADLLSHPILTGLLNGVAVTIIVGQLGKVLGITLDEEQVIEKIIALPPTLGNSFINLRDLHPNVSDFNSYQNVS